MYIPASFRNEDLARLHALVHEHDFALLVTAGDGGPSATHLPFVLRANEGEMGVLYGHVARANPHWAHFDGRTALVTFSGPHGYVSPRWYRDAKTAPTWNYAAVHAHGAVTPISAAELSVMLDELVSRHERDVSTPWTIADLTPARRRDLEQAIFGFRVVVARWEGAFKLSQNKSDEDRERVVAGLRDVSEPPSLRNAALADWVERELRAKRG